MAKYFYFLNRKNSSDGFREARNSPFVDKSGLIEFTNSKLSTKEKWICVSRPRRFGKSMALEMLSAYYTKNGNADGLFENLIIKQSADYCLHLNQHNVIYMNFSEYFENSYPSNGGTEKLSQRLISDLNLAYPGIINGDPDLPVALDMVYQAQGEKFIFLIDEWDTVFRFKKNQKSIQEDFLGFLKMLFKDKTYVELVYMTGILPIKKYNTGSALNMFREYTMIEPKKLGKYFGFTREEIITLRPDLDQALLNELADWYDGYFIEDVGHIYNPKSIIEALSEGSCKDYWNQSGGFSELEEYITLDFDGLGQDITKLLTGDQVSVNVLGFSNDLDSFRDKDEVITALIHLGYLTYQNGKVSIPNRELREEFANTVKKLSWGPVSELLNQSRRLLKATISMDAAAVAHMLENVHDDIQEFKEYSSEHTLKCVIHLAYYAAMDQYELKFEQTAGKGIADCVMIPRIPGLPGIILELKYNGTASQAIQQIRSKDYCKAFSDHITKIILVGINYDKKTKKHECMIELAK